MTTDDVDDMAALFGEPIHVYTRAQAIADGVLHDVTEVARAAGFDCPVAISSTLWADCIAASSDLPGHGQNARIWHLLCHVRVAVATLTWPASRVSFELEVRRADGTRKPMTVTAICGPGDRGESVMTLLAPDDE